MKTQGSGRRTMARCGFGVLAAWFVACAGDDTPPVDNALRGALATGFGGDIGLDPTGSSGAAGAGGGDSSGGAAGSGGSRSGTPNPGGGGSTVSGAGSSAVSSGGSGNGGNICDAYNEIFLVQCAGSVCHSEGSPNGVFAGDAPPLASDLVDVPSRNGAECGVLIDSKDIDNSVIVQMLTASQGPTCSPVPMPLGEEDLDATELACVKSWLSQFAD